jgi:uncharacterized alkaline shock family protein YloU
MALDDPAHAGPLPCGTLLDDLIAQVTEGSAPLDRAHQAACAYCQQALDAIRQVWEEFQALARSAVAIPEDLGERIMEQIRTLTRVSREGVAVAAERGETRIARPVLDRLVRAAARSVDDVAWASVLDVSEDGERPGRVTISLRLVIVYGPPAGEIAERVRQRVIADLERQAGVSVSRVEIDVGDLAVPDEIS